MPRNKRRRKEHQKGPPPADMKGIEEQLRLQRLASSNNREEKVKDRPPPAKLGAYVYDSKRNAYFPRTAYDEQSRDEIPEEIARPSYVPLSRRFPSLLQAIESCGSQLERRRRLKHWRSEKALQHLSVSSAIPVDGLEKKYMERRGIPLWCSSFTVTTPWNGHRQFSHLRHHDDGLHSIEQSRVLFSCGRLSSMPRDASLESSRLRTGTIKTRWLEMDSAMGSLFHFPDEYVTEYMFEFSGSDGNEKHTSGMVPGQAEDFCFLGNDTTVVFGAASPHENAALFMHSFSSVASLSKCVVNSAILSIETASWAPTQVAVAGHRDGHISWIDQRCPSAIVFSRPDIEFGNVVGLHTSSTAVLAQGASGRCRLFDIRKTVLHELRPPAKPQWMRTSDTVCKGMAVDPSNSLVLLPQARQEGNSSGNLSFGVWSLLTGDYLGERGSFATNYLELCPFVAKSTLLSACPQGRPAVWADLGTLGLTETQFDGRV